MHKKVFICSFGQPKGHYCWGHIYDELARRNRIQGSIDTYKYAYTPFWRVIDNITTRLSKIHYKKAHFDFKGALHRRIRALHTRQRISAAKASTVLHITTLDMPDPFITNAKHFLLIDSTWHSWSRFSSIEGYSKNLWRDIESLDRKSYQQASHIFTLGRHVCEDLVQHYGISPDKCTAIGGGLGSISPYFGPKYYRRRHLLFVARTRFESKGGPLLIDAFKILVSRNPTVHLTIVGGESMAESAANLPNVTVSRLLKNPVAVCAAA